jgi:hypothetical protein
MLSKIESDHARVQGDSVKGQQRVRAAPGNLQEELGPSVICFADIDDIGEPFQRFRLDRRHLFAFDGVSRHQLVSRICKPNCKPTTRHRMGPQAGIAAKALDAQNQPIKHSYFIGSGFSSSPKPWRKLGPL